MRRIQTIPNRVQHIIDSFDNIIKLLLQKKDLLFFLSFAYSELLFGFIISCILLFGKVRARLVPPCILGCIQRRVCTVD